VFDFTADGISLNEALNDQQTRTDAIQHVVDALIADDVIASNYGEIYPVTASHKDTPEFLIDRGLASWFGTRTFGQHLNGYVRRHGEILMWIARRAMDRGYEPGKLDQLVAGGFPYGITAEQNMRKECMEEAGMEPDLADRAIAVGTITCRYENPRGVKPETLYCYDLLLPDDFQPICTDGEVDEFMLMPIAEVAERVRETDEFKLNCNLVVIDFLIRHGYLTAEDQDYDLLVGGLHQ
jgi:8-oxo-dGTP pyrophosphatase MutT (NUDIX family)